MFFIFLIIHIKLIYCNEPYFDQQLTSTNPLGDAYLTFIGILTILICIFFFFAMFCAICCCKPDSEILPNCTLIVFHMIAAGILLISSFLEYAGCSYLSKEYVFRSLKLKRSFFLKDEYLIDYQFQQNVQRIISTIEDISNNDFNSINSTKSLKKLVNQYNSTFSNINEEYRISFNNIYFNPQTSNYLKVSIKMMDESRAAIFSRIIKFSNKYIQFSESIQNTLKSYNYNQSILKEGLSRIYYNDNEISIYIGYAYASLIIIFVVVYSVIFFYDNNFARCCSCLYSFFAFVIMSSVVASIIMGVHIHTESSYYGPNYKKNQNFEIEKIFKNFEIDDKLKDSFNEFDRFEVENLYKSINSENIHLNYMDICTQYSRNSLYRYDLNKMMNIIKMNEKKLVKMRELFDNISNFSFSVYPQFENIYNQTRQILKSIEKMKTSEKNFTDEIIENILGNNYNVNFLSSSSYENIVDGSNCCLISALFVSVGLLLMAIFIWLKRCGKCIVDSERGSVPVSNRLFRTIFLGKKIVYTAIYINSNESISVIVSRYSSPNRIVTIMQGQDEKLLSIESCFCRNDIFGNGFYFSATKKDALVELASFSNHQLNISKIGFIVCRVDFMNSLEVPLQKYQYFSYPKTLKEYSCNSVCGERNDLPDEFIVYSGNCIEPVDIHVATSSDLQ